MCWRVQGSSWMDPSMETQFGPFSNCAAGHLAVKPRKGAILLKVVYNIYILHCYGSTLVVMFEFVS